MMNLPSNLSKSMLLAAAIFWTIIYAEEVDLSVGPYILLSFIPIFIVSSLVIVITICPIFWFLEKEGNNKTKIFKTYFPYYTIISFSISMYCIIILDFETIVIAFFSSAFITTSQSWVWFAKEKTPQINNENI